MEYLVSRKRILAEVINYCKVPGEKAGNAARDGVSEKRPNIQEKDTFPPQVVKRRS